ncbi:MAG TPA: YiiD C-terminal domain-containing protein [Rhodocyclaceae bacterium]|nr:YiiD C-terminal domain-containing protein [Rhodocyclaceae bacterium]
MNAIALRNYLHDHIPLSRAMRVEVADVTATNVILAAPLAPNINHRDTVFGGSASAVAILAAWAVLHVRMQTESIAGRVVIQRNTMEYIRPIATDFTATSTIDDEAAWAKFLSVLRRRQRARISIAATLFCESEQAGIFNGEFVAIGAV